MAPPAAGGRAQRGASAGTSGRGAAQAADAATNGSRGGKANNASGRVKAAGKGKGKGKATAAAPHQEAKPDADAADDEKDDGEEYFDIPTAPLFDEAMRKAKHSRRELDALGGDIDVALGASFAARGRRAAAAATEGRLSENWNGGGGFAAGPSSPAPPPPRGAWGSPDGDTGRAGAGAGVSFAPGVFGLGGIGRGRGGNKSRSGVRRGGGGGGRGGGRGRGRGAPPPSSSSQLYPHVSPHQGSYQAHLLVGAAGLARTPPAPRLLTTAHLVRNPSRPAVAHRRAPSPSPPFGPMAVKGRRNTERRPPPEGSGGGSFGASPLRPSALAAAPPGAVVGPSGATVGAGGCVTVPRAASRAAHAARAARRAAAEGGDAARLLEALVLGAAGARDAGAWPAGRAPTLRQVLRSGALAGQRVEFRGRPAASGAVVVGGGPSSAPGAFGRGGRGRGRGGGTAAAAAAAAPGGGGGRGRGRGGANASPTAALVAGPVLLSGEVTIEGLIDCHCKACLAAAKRGAPGSAAAAAPPAPLGGSGATGKISCSDFEEHAGSRERRPAEAIWLAAAGVSLRDFCAAVHATPRAEGIHADVCASCGGASSDSAGTGAGAAAAAPPRRHVASPSAGSRAAPSAAAARLSPPPAPPGPAGALVPCSGCATAVHAACLGLGAAPPAGCEWFCAPCIEVGRAAGGGAAAAAAARARAAGEGRGLPQPAQFVPPAPPPAPQPPASVMANQGLASPPFLSPPAPAAAAVAAAAAAAAHRVHVDAPSPVSGGGSSAARREQRSSSRHRRLFALGQPGALTDGARVSYRTTRGDVLLRGRVRIPAPGEEAPAKKCDQGDAAATRGGGWRAASAAAAAAASGGKKKKKKDKSYAVAGVGDNQEGPLAGILCSCCSEVVSCSQFEAHAGRGSRRAPYDNIIVESSGKSLRKLAEAMPHTEDDSGLAFFPSAEGEQQQQRQQHGSTPLPLSPASRAAASRQNATSPVVVAAAAPVLASLPPPQPEPELIPVSRVFFLSFSLSFFMIFLEREKRKLSLPSSDVLFHKPPPHKPLSLPPPPTPATTGRLRPLPHARLRARLVRPAHHHHLRPVRARVPRRLPAEIHHGLARGRRRRGEGCRRREEGRRRGGGGEEEQGPGQGESFGWWGCCCCC